MFFGREEQLEQLKALLSKRTASLVTCRGRRRIGKSTLVEFFAERFGCRFIKIEGRLPHMHGHVVLRRAVGVVAAVDVSVSEVDVAAVLMLFLTADVDEHLAEDLGFDILTCIT